MKTFSLCRCVHELHISLNYKASKQNSANIVQQTCKKLKCFHHDQYTMNQDRNHTRLSKIMD